jgi:hypothetical protein
MRKHHQDCTNSPQRIQVSQTFRLVYFIRPQWVSISLQPEDFAESIELAGSRFRNGPILDACQGVHECSTRAAHSSLTNLFFTHSRKLTENRVRDNAIRRGSQENKHKSAMNSSFSGASKAHCFYAAGRRGLKWRPKKKQPVEVRGKPTQSARNKGADWMGTAFHSAAQPVAQLFIPRGRLRRWRTKPAPIESFPASSSLLSALCATYSRGRGLDWWHFLSLSSVIG